MILAKALQLLVKRRQPVFSQVNGTQASERPGDRRHNCFCYRDQLDAGWISVHMGTSRLDLVEDGLVTVGQKALVVGGQQGEKMRG